MAPTCGYRTPEIAESFAFCPIAMPHVPAWSLPNEPTFFDAAIIALEW